MCAQERSWRYLTLQNSITWWWIMLDIRLPFHPKDYLNLMYLISQYIILQYLISQYIIQRFPQHIVFWQILSTSRISESSIGLVTQRPLVQLSLLSLLFQLFITLSGVINKLKVLLPEITGVPHRKDQYIIVNDVTGKKDIVDQEEIMKLLE